MMNGDVPGVPITTLAGIASLSDLLPEMPLPGPLPQGPGPGLSAGHKSLLFHPRVAEEAQRLLATRDEALLPQLLQSLAHTSAQHIELKDGYAAQEMPLEQQPMSQMPDLLQALLQRNPHVFRQQGPASSSLPANQARMWNQATTAGQAASYPSPYSQSSPAAYPSPAHVSPYSSLTSPSPSAYTPQASPAPSYPPHMAPGGQSANYGSPAPYSPQQQPGNHTIPTQGKYAPIVNHAAPKGGIGYGHAQAPSTNSQWEVNSVANHGSHANRTSSSSSSSSASAVATPGMLVDNNGMVLAQGSGTSHATMDESQQQQRTSWNHSNANHGVNHRNHVSASAENTVQQMNQTNVTGYHQQFKQQHHQQQYPQQQQAQGGSQSVGPVEQPVVETKFRKEPVVKLNKISVEDIKVERTPAVEHRSSRAPPTSVDSNHRSPRSGRPSYKETSDSEGEEPKISTKSTPKKEEKVTKTPDKSHRNKEDGNHRRKRRASETESADGADGARQKKLRKVERRSLVVSSGTGSSHSGHMNAEDLMDTTTYQRFNRAVEAIFDQTEDVELAAEFDQEAEVPADAFISKHQLQDLCAEAAKLKAMGAMQAFPPERIVRILNVLELNVRDGAKISPLADSDESEEESRLWLDTCMERIGRATEAALCALHILTSPKMNKRVYLEDVIERVVHFVKFQLTNTIYPTYDPVYRIQGKHKDTNLLGKKKKSGNKDVREKSVVVLYHKLCQCVALLSELVGLQTLTDTTVLSLSSVAVPPFFVENVSELQLNALKLVTTIFAKYDKHRRLLLDDILASIARLPSSKRGLRTYRLSSDQYIQMLTALVLQLIQVVVTLPDNLMKNTNRQVSTEDQQEQQPAREMAGADRDVIVCSKYDNAWQTGISFLTVFLGKCGAKNEEVDYRPLFEHFLQDLLSTVNKPEWPAAEMLLSLLGKLLVNTFSNKSTDMALRLAALEYLGVVTARLRRDAVTSHLRTDTVDALIRQAKDEGDEEVSIKKKKKKDKDKDRDKNGGTLTPLTTEAERVQILEGMLLDYLCVQANGDPALLHARHFCIGQWYKDAPSYIARLQDGIERRNRNNGTGGDTPRKNTPKKKRRSEDDSEDEDADDDERFSGTQSGGPEAEVNNAEVLRLATQQRQFLLSKITVSGEVSTTLDAEGAELIARYLAATRPFSQSFDSYLKHILRVLGEPAIGVRTKAMKCLTQVVEADPAVLARSDMQVCVHHSFLDLSTSVREAAVDLVGKFVLSRPELIDKYYNMLSDRILDTGVSVRKRVIKIMKDICTECPQFPKIPEICVKMIRRVNDEETGIKKLVMEVFQALWFSPVATVRDKENDPLLQKVMNVTDVVAACRDTGLDWFESLLQSLFKPKEDKDDATKVVVEPPKTLLLACQQMVDCLVENVLRLEEASLERSNPHMNPPAKAANAPPPGAGASQRLVACLTTLYVFAKIRPQLLVKHAMTLQPYLTLRCKTQGDYQIISYVARTLELVVPLLEHPPETFMAQLEEDAVKLILQHDKTVVTACLSCLGSVVNQVTQNYGLIRDCFRKYYGTVSEYKNQMELNPQDPRLERFKPIFRRALFTVGLLLKYFDFRKKDVRGDLLPQSESIEQHVMDTLLFFMSQNAVDLQFYTLQAIGSVCIRHHEFMLDEQLKSLYHRLLTSPSASVQLRTQVLCNIEIYLQEEETRMVKQDAEWARLAKSENLKEMGDVSSGMASTVIQLYLTQLMESFLHPILAVRHTALRVVQLVLQQGLVPPTSMVPYLVCLSTDAEQRVSHVADKQLQEIEKKYPGFVHMKALQGIKLSFQLQAILQQDQANASQSANQQNAADEPSQHSGGSKSRKKNAAEEDYRGIVRGFRLKDSEPPAALNGFLYSLMRSSRNQRRAIAMSMLKLFEETSKMPLPMLLYLADNLACFPYQVMDEPHFIIHHVDIMVSVTGTNLLQSFKEALIPPTHVVNPEEEDDEETLEALLHRVPEDTSTLQELLKAAQGCVLLLQLKQHLKETYGVTDAKMSQYSPSEAVKVYEKTCTKKPSYQKFMPKVTLEALLQQLNTKHSETDPRALVMHYLEFKQLMLEMDREEPDEDGNVYTNSKVANEERLASAMRAYQVLTPPGERPGDSNSANIVAPVATPTSPRTPKVSSKPPKEHRSSRKSSKSNEGRDKKKKKKKRKRHSDSDDSDDDDPDFLG